MKLFILCLLAASAFAQPVVRQPNSTTVAGLPSAASSTRRVYIVTDGNSATDCTTGGGSTAVRCTTNGVVWSSGGGSGTVTSVDASCGISGGAITTTGTLVGRNVANAQTGTTYTILAGDCGKLITTSNAAAITVTVPAAGGSFPDGFFFDLLNIGAGTVTLSGATGTLTTGQSAKLVSTGATWRVLLGATASGSTITGCSSGLSVSVNDCIANVAILLTQATDQAGTPKYCRSTTGNATYTCTLTPTLTAYTRGGCLTLDANFANVTTATVNVDTLGAKSILNRAGAALAAGDITADKPIGVCYDGTQFIVQGDGGGSSTSASQSITWPFGASLTSAGGTGTVGSANEVHLYQFTVESPGLTFNYYQLYAKAGAGTVGVGLYDSSCSYITNSSAVKVAPTTANATQWATAAAITLTPGKYYFAMTSTVGADDFYVIPGEYGNALANAGGSSSTYPHFYVVANTSASGVVPSVCTGTRVALQNPYNPPAVAFKY